jgi:hypothetical protein
MSVMSQATARQNRNRAVDLTPWVAAAVGDVSDLRLPPGYRLMADARTPKGPFGFVLHRPRADGDVYSDDTVIVKRAGIMADPRAVFVELVGVAERHAEGAAT